jgi:hypothetical protein
MKSSMESASFSFILSRVVCNVTPSGNIAEMCASALLHTDGMIMPSRSRAPYFIAGICA